MRQPGWIKELRGHGRALFAHKDVRAVLNWLKDPILAVLIVFSASTAIAQPYYVPSGSMQPTLAIGDLLLVTKYSYGYDRFSIPYVNGNTPTERLFGRMPQVGDVVVFRLPRDTSVTLVKRVIGLPGDRIQMRHGRLWINGKELPLQRVGTGKDENGPDEDSPGSYFTVAKYIETLPDGRQHPIFKKVWNGPYDNTGVYVVPPGHLFMMGDNRDDSSDSRVSPEDLGVGFVPVANVVGRVPVVLASVDFANARGLWEWPFEFRPSRVLNMVR